MNDVVDFPSMIESRGSGVAFSGRVGGSSYKLSLGGFGGRYEGGRFGGA